MIFETYDKEEDHECLTIEQLAKLCCVEIEINGSAENHDENVTMYEDGEETAYFYDIREAYLHLERLYRECCYE